MLATPDGSTPAEVVAAASEVVDAAPRILSGGRLTAVAGMAPADKASFLLDTVELYSLRRRVREIRGRLAGGGLPDEETQALFRQATQGDDITLSARYWDDPRYRELARKRYEKRCAVRRGVLERAQRFIGELEREGCEEKRTLAKGLRAYFDALPPVLTREEMMIGRILAGQRRLAEQEAARRALGKEAGDRSRKGRSR